MAECRMILPVSTSDTIGNSSLQCQARLHGKSVPSRSWSTGPSHAINSRQVSACTTHTAHSLADSDLRHLKAMDNPIYPPSSIIATSVILPLLTAIAVSLRFHVRLRLRPDYIGMDDWTCLAACIFCIADGANFIVGMHLTSILRRPFNDTDLDRQQLFLVPPGGSGWIPYRPSALPLSRR